MAQSSVQAALDGWKRERKPLIQRRNDAPGGPFAEGEQRSTFRFRTSDLDGYGFGAAAVQFLQKHQKLVLPVAVAAVLILVTFTVFIGGYSAEEDNKFSPAQGPIPEDLTAASISNASKHEEGATGDTPSIMPSSEPDSGAGSEADAAAGSETDAGAGSETDAGAGSETDAGAGSETDAGAGSEPDAEAGSDAPSAFLDPAWAPSEYTEAPTPYEDILMTPNPAEQLTDDSIAIPPPEYPSPPPPAPPPVYPPPMHPPPVRRVIVKKGGAKKPVASGKSKGSTHAKVHPVKHTKQPRKAGQRRNP